MDSGTAHSKSVLPDRRNGILRRALLQSRSEVRKSSKHLISADCVEHLGPIAPEVEAFLSGHDAARSWPLLDHFTWLCSDADFWGCLQAIALAKKLECRPAETAPAPLSLGSFRSVAGADGLRLVCMRHGCPQIIAAAT